MRRLACLLFALALAGCGPRGEPPLQPNAPEKLSVRDQAPEGWTWAPLRPAGAPARRYGVAAPSAGGRSQMVLLLPGAEPAEAWFGVVNALLSRGFTVWLLAPSNEATAEQDAAAIGVMLDQVVRPPPGVQPLLVGQGPGAIAALRAMEGGLPSAGAVLIAPSASARDPDPERRTVAARWTSANPDFGFRWTSLARRASLDKAIKTDAAERGKIEAPLLEIHAGDDPAAAAANLAR